MKIWKSEEKGDDKIIAFFNETIYKVNPKPENIEQVLFDFSRNIPPTKDFMEIPLNYLKEIALESSKEYIIVFFGGDSYEHLKIKDEQKRTEIFEYFKQNIPRSTFLIDNYSKIRAGKKPLIAMCVVLVLCLWTIYISSGIEKGNEYQVVGQPHSIAGIILMIASLGTTNVLLIFGFLFSLALTSFYFKTRRKKVVQKIRIVRTP